MPAAIGGAVLFGNAILFAWLSGKWFGMSPELDAFLIDRLRRVRTASFRGLVGDAADTMTVIARFLALLELFREGAVAFDQVAPLAELTVRWTGADEGDLDLHDEFDEEDAAPGDPEAEQPDNRQPSEEA